LHQRIEKLVHADRFSGLVALLEVVALQMRAVNCEVEVGGCR
jgi:hypothetical protein